MMGLFGQNIGKGLVDDISNIVHDVLGIKDGLKNKVDGSSLPWNSINPNTSPRQPSKFMPPIDIEPLRWNKLYPYRLLVIDTNDSNSVVGQDSNQIGRASCRERV